MKAFAVVPYDRAVHEPFVLSTFCRVLHDPTWPESPWREVPSGVLVQDLRRHITLGRAVVATAMDDPDNFMGWAVCLPGDNLVVMAYTKYRYRQRWGIAGTLCTEAGVDLTVPTGVRYFTRAAERIGKKPGWNLFCSVGGSDVVRRVA